LSIIIAARAKLEKFARAADYLYLYNQLFTKAIMNTKLTLTIEQALIEKAKGYAKEKGRSLSDIVENYFKILVKEDSLVKSELTPITNSLKGSFKEPKGFNYKVQLTKALSKRHMHNG